MKAKIYCILYYEDSESNVFFFPDMEKAKARFDSLKTRIITGTKDFDQLVKEGYAIDEEFYFNLSGEVSTFGDVEIELFSETIEITEFETQNLPEELKKSLHKYLVAEKL